MNDNQRMRNMLHKMSKQFALELQIEAYPSKDTATLDKSFKNKGYTIEGDSYTLKCSAVHYAKFVDGSKNNQRAKNFITKACNNVIDSNLHTIIQTEFDGMMKDFFIEKDSNSYKNRKNKF